jgi:hypothetical protein
VSWSSSCRGVFPTWLRRHYCLGGFSRSPAYGMIRLVTADWKQPPPPRPRRRNTFFLRLYDRPIHRDPLAWWTAAWAVLAFAALASSPQASATGLPRWADALFGAVTFTILFGIVPAFVRLQIRRFLWRRREASRASTNSRGDTPPSSPFPEPPTQAMPAVGEVRNRHDADAGPAYRRESPHPRPRPDTHRTQPPAAHQSPQRGTDNQVAARIPESSSNSSHFRHSEVSPHTSGRVEETKTSRDAAQPELLRARQLQYPIARAVRAVQTAPGAKAQYDALIQATDAICVTLATSAASWLRDVEPESQGIADLLEAYKGGVSLGAWTSVLRRASAVAAQPDRAAPGGLATAAKKGKVNLLKQLDELLRERNKWAHGGAPRAEGDASSRLDALMPALLSALTLADYMREMEWVVTESSSYDPRSRTFRVSALHAMADHPEFERHTLTLTEPVPDGQVFQLVDGRPIDLAPFVVNKYCSDCERPELFYTDKVLRDGTAVLKSFGTPHQLMDSAIGSDLRSLSSE